MCANEQESERARHVNRVKVCRWVRTVVVDNAFVYPLHGCTAVRGIANAQACQTGEWEAIKTAGSVSILPLLQLVRSAGQEVTQYK